jgi:hypothetical protein
MNGDRMRQWWLAATNHPPRDIYLYRAQPVWRQQPLPLDDGGSPRQAEEVPA